MLVVMGHLLHLVDGLGELDAPVLDLFVRRELGKAHQLALGEFGINDVRRNPLLGLDLFAGVEILNLEAFLGRPIGERIGFGSQFLGVGIQHLLAFFGIYAQHRLGIPAKQADSRQDEDRGHADPKTLAEAFFLSLAALFAFAFALAGVLAASAFFSMAFSAIVVPALIKCPQAFEVQQLSDSDRN
ncbi:MAG: hypothetical protein VW268_12625 [Rhodospirillaceae bacterium]